MNTDWLVYATEEDLQEVVHGDAMNLALSCLTWHKEELLKVQDG